MLVGVMKVKNIVLHEPMIRWYPQRGLRPIAVHQLVKYEQGKTFSWFPEEVANTRSRHEADQDPSKKTTG